MFVLDKKVYYIYTDNSISTFYPSLKNFTVGSDGKESVKPLLLTDPSLPNSFK